MAILLRAKPVQSAGEMVKRMIAYAEQHMNNGGSNMNGGNMMK